ncbi:hypothetical protein [Cytobacillus horneckiae]|uniref:Uncharacterized protein n=1 Tax=Cytobacillus horneckiae TaxID=549687 RepID=A0A2N0ZB32_9BACI|nr:hypothetical protein [Cytobacillus horneckiae]MEC1155530.1 hypothetical protein [Cytobacillus horneckiae]MED2936849.1 hypothetical protein [Cytobacillus horneckiae]PKG26731.1 hypothetical protein CWS20_22380 [Cytobacillus horneckiae]
MVQAEEVKSTDVEIQVMREIYTHKVMGNIKQDYYYYYNPSTGKTWCENTMSYVNTVPNHSYFNPKNPFEKACDYN